MDQIRSIIAEVARLDREATRGPWDSLSEVCSFGYGKGGYNQCAGDPPDEEDAAFILRSRTLLPRLAAALAVAVEGLVGVTTCTCTEVERCLRCRQAPSLTRDEALARIAAALAGEGTP